MTQPDTAGELPEYDVRNDGALQTTVRRQLMTAMVQRYLFCPVSGVVLDVRRLTVFGDADHDPVAVIARDADTPEVRARIAQIDKVTCVLTGLSR